MGTMEMNLCNHEELLAPRSAISDVFSCDGVFLPEVSRVYNTENVLARQNSLH